MPLTVNRQKELEVKDCIAKQNLTIPCHVLIQEIARYFGAEIEVIVQKSDNQELWLNINSISSIEESIRRENAINNEFWVSECLFLYPQINITVSFFNENEMRLPLNLT